MNRIIQFVILLGFFQFTFSQIKEEQLILSKKRIPEVKKIEKKYTSVKTDKNYPPKEKRIQDSLNLRYEITDVPVVSDFKVSTIERTDIKPNFENFYQKNYFRAGAGNYGKILANANFSGKINEQTEAGADLDFVSTTGSKKDYKWDSSQMNATLGTYLNHYGTKGKSNISVNYGIDAYKYYGIYAIEPSSDDIGLKQSVGQFSANAYYDHYSNDILDDIRVKTSFLGDYFNSKETNVELNANLAKNKLHLGGDIYMNLGLGVGLISQRTKFKLLNQNYSHFFELSSAPKLTFYKEESYLSIGSELAYLNQTQSSKKYNDILENSRLHWFPKVEILFATSDKFKFYVGVDGGIRLNSYKSLLDKNPYLVSDQEIMPTITRYQLYAGFKGDIDKTFKYDVAGSFSKLKTVPFFTHNGLFDPNYQQNRDSYDYLNTFSTIYDDGALANIKGSAEYFPIYNLSLKGSIDFTRYNMPQVEHAYHLHHLQAEINAKYSVLNQKLLFGFIGFLAAGNQVEAYDMMPNDNALSSYVPNKKKVSVGNYFDLNLSAEYKFHKNFSIFAIANNILNTKYQNFYGYKVLGTQILGGIMISF